MPKEIHVIDFIRTIRQNAEKKTRIVMPVLFVSSTSDLVSNVRLLAMVTVANTGTGSAAIFEESNFSMTRAAYNG